MLDDLEGFAIYLFVVSKNNLNKLISDNLISNFGTFALPKKIYYLTELPKTRSGKILRRLLRSITIDPNSKNYGDLTTILNSNIIEELKYKIKMPKITLENIIKIISKNINEPISNINIKSNSDDFDRWDSLSHIRIIIDLEKLWKK